VITVSRAAAGSAGDAYLLGSIFRIPERGAMIAISDADVQFPRGKLHFAPEIAIMSERSRAAEDRSRHPDRSAP
jgi:hypothetical protein